MRETVKEKEILNKNGSATYTVTLLYRLNISGKRFKPGVAAHSYTWEAKPGG